MQYLKQSDGVTLMVGPFLDKNDGVTALTTLTAASISSAAIFKDNVRTAITITDSGGDHDFAHLGDGYYSLEITPGNVDTTGRWELTLRNDALFLPVWVRMTVLTANGYDSIVTGTDHLQVDVVEIIGSSTEWASLQLNILSILSQLSMIEGGVAFNSGTHSLVAIVALLQAILGGTGSLGGGGAGTSDTLLTGGFLSRLVSLVRKATDEPHVNAKYTDSDIMALAVASWTQLWSELKMTADNAVIVRYDVTVAAGTQNYLLPPAVGEIHRISKINVQSGLPEWEIVPKSFFNPAGPGFTIEGNVVRVTPIWSVGEVLRLEYVPSGEILPHEGVTGEAVLADPAQFVLAATPTAGVLDNRPNCFAGYFLRVFGATGTQERTVASYDHTLRLASLSVPFDPVLPSGPLHYEVVPVFMRLGEMVLAQAVALTILSQEGNVERTALIEREYQRKLRGFRLHLTGINARRAGRFEGDQPGNRRYRGSMENWRYHDRPVGLF